MRLLPILAGAVLVGAPALAAQTAVRGRVVDAASGRPLAGAEVRLEGVDTVSVRADAGGRFSARASRAGEWILRVRAVGYVAHRARLDLGGADWDRELRLDAAVRALDQLVVTAARRAQRLGDAVTTTELVTRADLERTGASDLASVLTEQTGSGS
jgi:hypothetical protein